MARILALDVGEKVIGIAVSDESEAFAFPREAIVRQEGYRRDMAALRKLIEDEQIGEVVVGLPLMLDGSRGVQVEKIEAFVEALGRYTSVPIHTVDERLSTSEAQRSQAAPRTLRSPSRITHHASRSRQTASGLKEKCALDSASASVILQSHLARKHRAVRSE